MMFEMDAFDADALDAEARRILKLNDKGTYTVPTAGLYPYQWNWDSAFAAWGFATFDVDRAWQEVETLFDGQWPNGMVPHILFRQDDPSYFPGPNVWGTQGVGPIPSSGVSQPAVASTFIRAIWERDKAAGEPRLRALLPKMTAWHRWYMQWRTTEAGAVIATHPWEAGCDNCANWDSAMAMIDPVDVGAYTRRDTSHVDPSMRPTKADYDRYIWLVQRGRRLGWDEAKLAEDRPFAVANPLMTFTLLRANRDLTAMAAALGEDCTELEGWTAQLEEGALSLYTKGGFFDAINMRSGAHTGNLTSASFLCWYAGISDPHMERFLAAALFEGAGYPVASLAKSSPDYDPKRYWRGPTWAMMNALIGIGLTDCGKLDLAERLRSKTCALIAEHGFAEYFNPETGEPAGGGTFTWTAAVWLAWASPTAAPPAGGR